MNHDIEPFVFPELPDEAVVAINDFIEDFYTAFQNHYFVQLHRWYHEQRTGDDQSPINHNPSF